MPNSTRKALIPKKTSSNESEDRLLEQFLDELLAGNALDDVFDNPRRNPPLPSLAEMIGDGPKDMDAIKERETPFDNEGNNKEAD